MIHSKQHRGCRIQDPGTRGKHQTKIINPWCTSRGCRVQNSGPCDLWLPVVENSRLFAQRAHSARCAPSANVCPQDTGIRPSLLRPVPNVAWSSVLSHLSNVSWAGWSACPPPLAPGGGRAGEGDDVASIGPLQITPSRGSCCFTEGPPAQCAASHWPIVLRHMGE